jgi:hypothetical protein
MGEPSRCSGDPNRGALSSRLAERLPEPHLSDMTLPTLNHSDLNEIVKLARKVRDKTAHGAVPNPLQVGGHAV